MSNEHDKKDEHQSNESESSSDHGSDPQPKESFKEYSARKSKDFESAGMIKSFRGYLNSADPSLFIIHALVLFVLSVILDFLATRSLGISFSNQSGLLFFGLLSSLVRAFAVILVAWAVGRLIADAIKEGSKS